jgi:hypothetical protein
MSEAGARPGCGVNKSRQVYRSIVHLPNLHKGYPGSFSKESRECLNSRAAKAGSRFTREGMALLHCRTKGAERPCDARLRCGFPLQVVLE